jgi:hypothetical protein
MLTGPLAQSRVSCSIYRTISEVIEKSLDIKLIFRYSDIDN